LKLHGRGWLLYPILSGQDGHEIFSDGDRDFDRPPLFYTGSPTSPRFR
jgi:hypothetical protein